MRALSGKALSTSALKGRSYADPARTFIVGHSIGGVVGPLVAAQEPVRGLFVMETLGITWFEYELINTRRQLKLGGNTPAEIGDALLMKQWCAHSYVQQVAAQNLPALWARLKGVEVGVLYGAADCVTARSISVPSTSMSTPGGHGSSGSPVISTIAFR